MKTFILRHPRKILAAATLLVIISLDFIFGAFHIPATVESYRIPHPNYHHGFLPNQHARMQWGDRVYTIATNSIGLRDRDVRRISATNPGRRYVLIGDSMTEGLGVSFQDSFAGILQEQLRSDGIEVLNAAVVSYSPKLYYLKIRYLIEKEGVQFDRLFVFPDLSDLQDEFLYEDFAPSRLTTLKTMALRLQKFFYQHSLTYFSLTTIWQNKSVDGFYLGGVFNWAHAINRFTDKEPDFRKLRDLWTVDDDVFERWGKKGLELAALNMNELVKLTRDHGIEMTIVVYPWPVQIAAGDYSGMQEEFWRWFSEKTGCGFISLEPYFSPVGSTPAAIIEQYYIPGDSHWNEAGHKLVADVLLDAMAEQDRP